MPRNQADAEICAALATGMHYWTSTVASSQVFSHTTSCRSPTSRGADQKDAKACLGWVRSAAVSWRTAFVGKHQPKQQVRRLILSPTTLLYFTDLFLFLQCINSPPIFWSIETELDSLLTVKTFRNVTCAHKGLVIYKAGKMCLVTGFTVAFFIFILKPTWTFRHFNILKNLFAMFWKDKSKFKIT